MLKYWILLRSFQFLFDTLIVFLAFILAYVVRVGFINSTDFPLVMYGLLAFGASILWTLFLAFTKYYRIPPRTGPRFFYDLLLILAGGIVANGVLIVTYFFSKDLLFSRLISVAALVHGVALLTLSYFAWRLVLAHLIKQESFSYKTLVLGANRMAEKIIQNSLEDKYAAVKIIGVLDPYGICKQESLSGVPVLGKLNKLDQIIQTHAINHLIQCDAYEHTINLISLCEEKDIKFEMTPSLRGIYEPNLRIRELSGNKTLSYVKRDYESSGKKFTYKGVDALLRQFFSID